MVQDIAEAAAVGFGLTSITTESLPKTPKVLAPWLPLLYGIAYSALKDYVNGNSVKNAVFNGILGGILAVVTYRGTVGKAKNDIRLERNAE